MPVQKYKDLQAELASAMVLHMRTKAGRSLNGDVGPAEDRLANDKALMILELVDTSIMNRSLTPHVTDALRNNIIQEHRHSTKLIDIDKLIHGLEQEALRTFNFDATRDLPKARAIYKHFNGELKKLSTFER